MLIDTPGFSPADLANNRNLAASLAAHRELVDVHLVLSAAVLPRVQLAAIERFSAFGPPRFCLPISMKWRARVPCLKPRLRAGLPIPFIPRATGTRRY